MKEQSHKEEMSAALRGDFQRLRERGVSPALAPQDAVRPEERANAAAPSPDPEVAAADTAAEPPAEEPEPPRRSWLSRLAGREHDGARRP